ncbi:Beta-1,3-galactosyltransferase 1 [Orchesella cincta]|uniref:Hexosyltransferase n=1 Tax=Orchesella cincta TaxID=48709 RepID=A0A1D2NGR3_ORCCI|nr:Beta-1,3-galactosyltransferase 1 [Orchesella cincta]
MRKFRTMVRLLFCNSQFRTVQKFILIFVVVILFFMYIQERHSKEALIDLALGSKNVEDLVKPYNDTLILNGLKFLGTTAGKEQRKNAFVVIVVTSLPGSEQRRSIIRETWGNKAFEQYGATVVFFVGRPQSLETLAKLHEEVRRYQDLIVDDFTESYYALAIKTLRVMKYFQLHHPKSKFLVKTDDDVFVNVQNLVHYSYSVNKEMESRLRNQTSTSYFIGGVIHSGREPHTWNPFSKWYAPSEVWNNVYDKVVDVVESSKTSETSELQLVHQSKLETKTVTVNTKSIDKTQYPPYAEGNFYILSDETVTAILKVSVNVPLYHLEDVYVTGVLATWVLGIEKENIPFISSSSNIFPRFSYAWFKLFTSPKDIIAFHCDNYVELMPSMYLESRIV